MVRALAVTPFLLYYAVMVYSERWTPRAFGMAAIFSSQEGLVVGDVLANSPAGRAGMESGDVVVAVDSQPIRYFEDWKRVMAGREIGRTYHFHVSRRGEQSELRLTIGRQPGDTWGRLERKRYVQGLLLLLCLLVVFRGPGTPAASLAVWFLAALGTAPLFPEPEMTAVWRDLPLVVSAFLWVPQASHFLLLPLSFTFFAVLPRPVFQRPWLWAAVWAPFVPLFAWLARYTWKEIYQPPQFTDLPRWLAFVAGLVILAYGAGAVAALLVNYRRLADPDARRRMFPLVAGAVIGLSPALPFLAGIFWGTLTQSPIIWFFVSTRYRLVALSLFAVFAVTMIYSVVRHRVLELTDSNV
jgi:hypothetical protein